MDNLLKSRRSLTFYQTNKPSRSLIDSQIINASVITTPILANSLTSVMSATNSSAGNINTLLRMIDSFNTEFEGIYRTLNQARTSSEMELSQVLANDPTSDSMRRVGVKQMWDYEKAIVQMGGDTSGFTLEQQQELLETGKIRNFEGHHINSVSVDPSLQANPDNLRALEEHRNGGGPCEHFKAHNYDWRKPTKGDLRNRNQDLRNANDQRVAEKNYEIKAERHNIIKNELVGIGSAIAIGFGVGFTIGFIVDLAQKDLSAESVRIASIAGLKTAKTSALIGGVSYLMTRSIGEIATKALTNTVSNYGFEITKNIARMCSMASIGMLSITLYSTYHFVKLKRMGYASKDVLIQVGKQAILPLTTLFISIAAQGKWGGKAGMIVSTSIGLAVISYRSIESINMRKLAEDIQIYTINKSYPIY